LAVGAASVQEIEAFEQEEQLEEEESKKGQVLWIRGLGRLQHQVRSILYFQSNSQNASLSVISYNAFYQLL